MEHLELLSKVLRYAGLNLNPQLINIILDEPTSTLVKNLDEKLKKTPNPTLDEIDAIVSEIQDAQKKAAELLAAELLAAEEAKKGKKIKPILDKV